MSSKVNILDIARLAGVSRTTVSRVLNESHNVDPETRQRVLQVIEEQRYIPSISAKGLKGHSRLIGMLMPTIYWSALLDMIWSATTVARKANYGIVLYSCADENEYVTLPEQVVQARLTAGFLSTVYTQPAEHLIKLYQQGFPVVLIDPVDLTEALPRVSVDHRGGAVMAVRHLLDLGHQKIGYIQGSLAFRYSHERYQGYCDALQEAGLPLDPHLIFADGEGYVAGANALKRYLEMERRPSAIFADDDYIAYGFMEQATLHGIRIPEELALVGFNDDKILIPDDALQRRHLALTTVHQPFPEMGQCGVELLLSLIDRRYTLSDEWKQYLVHQELRDDSAEAQQEAHPPQIRLPTRLVVRETSGARLT